MPNSGEFSSVMSSGAISGREILRRRFGTVGALMAVISFGFLGFATTACAADDAASAFKNNCVVCHAADGTGSATGKALNAPDLNSAAVQKLTAAQMIDTISNGKNNMPPFKGILSDDQIKDVVTYLRSTFGKKK
jgi:cytochrome c6